MDESDLERLLLANEQLRLLNEDLLPQKPKKRKRKGSPSEQILEQIRERDLPRPLPEVQFHPLRKWRFDFAWPEKMVALEVDGGIWMQTKTGRGKGHAHPKRFLQDIEKMNEAALLGWLVIRVAPEMISDGRAIEWLERALGAKAAVF